MPDAGGHLAIDNATAHWYEVGIDWARRIHINVEGASHYKDMWRPNSIENDV